MCVFVGVSINKWTFFNLISIFNKLTTGTLNSSDARQLLTNLSLQLTHTNFQTYPSPVWAQLFFCSLSSGIAFSYCMILYLPSFNNTTQEWGVSWRANEGCLCFFSPENNGTPSSNLSKLRWNFLYKGGNHGGRIKPSFYKSTPRILTCPASGLSWTKSQMLLKMEPSFPLIVRLTETFSKSASLSFSKKGTIRFRKATEIKLKPGVHIPWSQQWGNLGGRGLSHLKKIRRHDKASSV